MSDGSIPDVQVSISDAYDSGNVEFVSSERVDGVWTVHVRIKPDVYTVLEKISHMQYFSFRATVNNISKPTKIVYVIDNASKASYPAAWTGTTVCYNTTDPEDSEAWFRNSTTRYVDGTLTWTHLHVYNCSSYFSYFPPFTYARHLKLVGHLQLAAAKIPHANVESLGQTLDGREIECVTIGTGDKICWIIHRQHPGETMAEHYAEGLLYRLFRLDDVEDPIVEQALERFRFYVVPCMCPDGGVRGHLRTNGVGANLNREWATKGDYQAPTLERSPEVYHVLHKMDETGVDLFLDVHGDEELPYNFISGAEQTPAWSKRLESLHGAFVASYHRANSDMQQEIGYPPPESREEAQKYMNVATNQVSTRFDCLGMTLEMPFKDCESNVDPDRGWSAARSRALGASVLAPLLYVYPYLRDETEFWTTLPPEDAYVEPHDDYQGFKPLTKRLYSDVRATSSITS